MALLLEERSVFAEENECPPSKPSFSTSTAL